MTEEIRLVVSVPTSGTVKMGFAFSLAQMMAYVAGTGLSSKPGVPLSIELETSEGSVVHINRENLVQNAITKGCTHLMFLDDDMLFAPNIMDLMFSRNKDIVVANYLMKTDNPRFLATGLDGKECATTKDKTGIEPVLHSGFGVSLFNLNVIKDIEQPWFKPIWVPEKGIYTTEDVPFFHALRKAGHTVYLDHDASKLVAHMGGTTWDWSQYRTGGELV